MIPRPLLLSLLVLYLFYIYSSPVVVLSEMQGKLQQPRLPVYSVFVRYPSMAINDIVQYTPTFFWLPKPLFLCGSIVLLSTLVLSS